MSPAGGGIVNAAALFDRSACREAPTAVQGWLDLARARCPALARRLAGAAPVPGTQAAVAPVRLYAKPTPWDGVPLVGDACAAIPPLCGDGMSMALRAAQLCAASAERYLCGALSLSEWEEAYALAIRGAFSGPLRWGEPASARCRQAASGAYGAGRGALRAAARRPARAGDPARVDAARLTVAALFCSSKVRPQGFDARLTTG
ncbi:NAD(P)/FAD-dependent oxidoreductase [Cohnella rhizosphaerae]|uniref:Uncharacterized protein n=1 Tax=Cohnella rhizosphaerae TaxID=1457232 RepID=A0A9X4KWM1_9BACL|nr:hypothetical protein [Cohnella rhizosphaerae]MDG0812629.1 hypothetical protein [Cohnella rhizosphaerae]